MGINITFRKRNYPYFSVGMMQGYMIKNLKPITVYRKQLSINQLALVKYTNPFMIVSLVQYMIRVK